MLIRKKSTRVYAIAAIVILAIIATPVLIGAGVTVLDSPKPSDYDKTFMTLQTRFQNADTQSEELAYRAFKIAQLSGNLSEYKKTEMLLAPLPESLETLYLKAKIALHTHNTATAEDLIHQLLSYADSRAVVLDIQLDIQKGELAAAKSKLEQILDQQNDWQLLSLLAVVHTKQGQPTQAEALYVQAQDQISVKEMDVYAWLELQRGILDLEQSDIAAAHAHFDLANRAYSGHWLIEEHLAETLVLLGKPKMALSYYESVITKNTSPMYLKALAELLQSTDTQRASELLSLAEDRTKAYKTLYPFVDFEHDTPQT